MLKRGVAAAEGGSDPVALGVGARTGSFEPCACEPSGAGEGWSAGAAVVAAGVGALAAAAPSALASPPFWTRTPKREEGRLALCLQATQEGRKAACDVLAVRGVVAEDRDGLIEEAEDLRLSMLDDTDCERLEEKRAGKEDALMQTRGSEAEVALWREKVDSPVEDGLSGGECVEDPLAFLQVQERGRHKPQVVGFDGAAETLLQSTQGDRVAVQAHVFELHLQ